MTTTHLEIVRDNFSRRSDIQGELRQIDEAATTDQRGYTEDEAGRIEELRAELSQIDGRIEQNLELELRTQAIEEGIAGSLLGALVDRETGEVEDTRSISDAFVDSDEFRAFAQNGGQGNRFPSLTMARDLRAVTTLDTSGAQVSPQRLGRYGRDLLDRRVFLSDLLPHIPLGVGSAEIVVDKTPAADIKPAETAEGADKPQSGITLDVVTEPTPTIAHWANLTRQAAADAPQVRAYLEGRLRYGLKRRADDQIIGGSGTGNIVGLLNRTGINTVAPSAAEDAAVTIRKAITELEVADAVPEIVVLNPRDAETFDLTNYDQAGIHAVPNLTVAGSSTAWGMTIVKSNAISAGTALLIDPMATAVLDRQAATAYMTDSHASNFTKNILTLLLELRLGLGVFEAKGICKVTFNDGSAGGGGTG